MVFNQIERVMRIPVNSATLPETQQFEQNVLSRDPKQIAQAMIRLASDRQLNLRMGEAAHAKGAVRNTWQHYGDRLLEDYQRRFARLRPAMVRPHLTEAAVPVGLDEQQK